MAINVIISRERVSGTGHFYWGGEGSLDFAEVSLPSGVTTLNRKRRPDHVEDRFRRRYIAGQFSKILVFTEFLGLHLAGISKPAAPTLAAAGGGSIEASNNIGYLAFRHKVGSTIVHEGDISDGSNTLTLDGTQQRQWTLPGSAPDVRVTHVVAYVSVDGALPKEVFERPIADVTFTEDTATGALGDPPPVDPQGNLRNARGIPPYTRFIRKYHRRAWYFGDPNFPYRLWYSELDEFESVGPLNFIEHLENETVVGGGAAGDQLCTFGQTVSYAVQGWDESDFRIFRTSPSIGCTSHFSIVNINELLYFACELGPYVYVPGAGFRPLAARDLHTWWRQEYAANPDAFDDCVSGDDRVGHIWKLLVIYGTAAAGNEATVGNPTSRYILGFYQGFDPTVGDGTSLPQWGFDFRDREDTCMSGLRQPGIRRSDFFTGSSDGYIRKENIDSNDDDDGDSYQKQFMIDTPHYLPKGQVGDDSEGCEFTHATLYLKSETSPWRIEARAGDDSAYLATRPNWFQDVAASREQIGNLTRVPKTSHAFGPLKGVAGKGVTIRVTIPRAHDVEYRGLALAWTDGIQTRPMIEE